MKEVAPKIGLDVSKDADITEEIMGSFLPISTHFDLVIPTIQSQGTEEQCAQWLPACKRLEVIGTFALTEIGHGSDLQSLETTATFDGDADEIVIHSPSVSATKFWPGSLGSLASHALVGAILTVNGKRYKQHMFIVPLEAKGVERGDIGPKMMWESLDNGYARFTHVRIPRANMLQKYVELTREGEYKQRGDPRKLHTGLLVGRVGVIEASSRNLMRALTIALRYGVCRRQFADGEKKG